MIHSHDALKKFYKIALAAGLVLGISLPSFASVVRGGIFQPTITSGALPDSPAAHVDPNVVTSPFSGVVSINIVDAGGSYICSGALVGKRQVVSAGHCIDADGNGHAVDLNAPGNSVRVIFNNDGNYNAPGNFATHVISASAVSMNPFYQGFGNCPSAVVDPSAFCVNDDISVITLSKDAPSSAKIYRVDGRPIESGQHIIMAGYGTSGDGIHGYTVNPSFSVKRSGENYVDLFDKNDELNFSGANEVWYADFDGAGQDTFCDYFGVCTPILPNNRESGIGGGDSGGPSFVVDQVTGEYLLVANNTFSGTLFDGQVPGTFGTYFGGITLAAYIPYLAEATGGAIDVVPEPANIAILALGLLMLVVARRRTQQ